MRCGVRAGAAPGNKAVHLDPWPIPACEQSGEPPLEVLNRLNGSINLSRFTSSPTGDLEAVVSLALIQSPNPPGQLPKLDPE